MASVYRAVSPTQISDVVKKSRRRFFRNFRLPGALSGAEPTQAWPLVYEGVQRAQQPKSIDIRRLGAIARELQQSPQKFACQRIARANRFDVHAGSGRR